MYKTKRILSVRLIREVDTDADTSYLGQYSNTADSEFATDRAHLADCASLFPVATPENPERTLYECGICSCYHPWNFGGDCRDDSNRFGDPEEYAAKLGIDSHLVDVLSMDDRIAADTNERGECTCGGHNISSREYRYFNPATVEPFNESVTWFPQHSPECNTQKGFKAGEICNCHGMSTSEKYEYWRKAMLENARKDYERMESLNAGDWCYIGIRAQAQVMLYVLQENAESITGPIQTITSGGLWGIESDSDESYLKEVESEQLAELKSQLRAIGFSTRAISKAFKSITEERP